MYEELLEKNSIIKIDMILYYIDGTRISGDKVQYKKECKKSCILKFFKNLQVVQFLPMTRKYSQEYTVMMPQDISKIETVIVRHIIYYASNNENKCSLRISLERCFGNEGGHYSLHGEVEYSRNLYKKYTALNKMENVLLEKLRKIAGEELAKLDTTNRFTVPTQQTLFRVPSRVFSNFTE